MPQTFFHELLWREEGRNPNKESMCYIHTADIREYSKVPAVSQAVLEISLHLALTSVLGGRNDHPHFTHENTD